MKEEKNLDALLKLTTMMHASLGNNQSGLSYLKTMKEILDDSLFDNEAEDENMPS